MDPEASKPTITVTLGNSPLTDFIVVFSDKMHILDQICVDMTKIVDDIDSKEQELEAIYDDLYRRASQSPRCPSLKCGCWTVAPLTKRFLNKFREMREQKNRFRSLKEKAYSFIDGFKETDDESLMNSTDLPAK